MDLALEGLCVTPGEGSWGAAGLSGKPGLEVFVGAGCGPRLQALGIPALSGSSSP